MTTKYTFLYELEENDYNEVKVNLTYEVSIDNNYGADRDGNRGIRQEFIDDIDFNILDGIEDITERVKTQYPTDYKKIEQMAIDNAKELRGYEGEDDGDYDDSRDIDD